MYRGVGWPLRSARTLKELKCQEKAYKVSDLYLWLLLVTIYKNAPTVSGHLTNIHIKKLYCNMSSEAIQVLICILTYYSVSDNHCILYLRQ